MKLSIALAILLLISVITNIALFYLGKYYNNKSEKLWWKHFRLIYKYRTLLKSFRKLAHDYAEIAVQPRMVRINQKNHIATFDKLPSDFVGGEPVVIVSEQIFSTNHPNINNFLAKTK